MQKRFRLIADTTFEAETLDEAMRKIVSHFLYRVRTDFEDNSPILPIPFEDPLGEIEIRVVIN